MTSDILISLSYLALRRLHTLVDAEQGCVFLRSQSTSLWWEPRISQRDQLMTSNGSLRCVITLSGLHCISCT